MEVTARGDTGVIRFPLQSSSASDADLEAATLDVAAPPQFIVKSASLRGPHTIPPAQSYAFVVEYEIAADAPDGSFTVTLTPRSPTEGTDGIEVAPALYTLKEEVGFTGGSPQASDGRAVLSVFKNAPFDSLKLSFSPFYRLSPPRGGKQMRGPGAASPGEGEASTEGVDSPRRSPVEIEGYLDMAEAVIVRPGASSLVVECRFIRDRRIPHPIASFDGPRPAGLRGSDTLPRGQRFLLRAFFFNGPAARAPLLARAQRTGALGLASIPRPALDAGRAAGPRQRFLLRAFFFNGSTARAPLLARGGAGAWPSLRDRPPPSAAPHARRSFGPRRPALLRAFSFNDRASASFVPPPKEFLHSGPAAAAPVHVVHRIHSAATAGNRPS